MKRRLRVGDKIHIKSRWGIYTVVKLTRFEIYITCNTWSYTDAPVRMTFYNDFKCLAGGMWNLNPK